jgi:hypothetical protein
VDDADIGHDRRNVVLTGLPRSGTTLACHLLNKLPNTVALLEPLEPGRFVGLLPDREAVGDAMERWYTKSRRRALKEGEVVTRHVGGEIPDNPFEASRPGKQPRQWLASKGRIGVGKDLDRDFFLVVKDPPMFTALLPILAGGFPRSPWYAIPLPYWHRGTAWIYPPGKGGRPRRNCTILNSPAV